MIWPPNPGLPPALIAVPQRSVTPEMTAFATAVDRDLEVPIWAMRSRDFGEGPIVARVEVHTWIGATGEKRPDGLRGVTLYMLRQGSTLADLDAPAYGAPPAPPGPVDDPVRANTLRIAVGVDHGEEGLPPGDDDPAAA